MKKGIILIAMIVVTLGFFAGKYLYDKKQRSNDNERSIINDNVIALREEKNIQDKILVDSSETKITPNTKIIEKIYYTECNHLIVKEEKPNKEFINLNEEEFKTKMAGYDIQKFTTEEVIIYKDRDDFCNEHYLIKDDEGHLGIYQLDKNEKVKDLFELTEIPTDFLPEEDKEKIKNGLRVDTKEELSSIIEDFE